MSFHDLFKRKQIQSIASPRVRQVVDKTIIYLRQVSSHDASAEVRPALVARALDENPGNSGCSLIYP